MAIKNKANRFKANRRKLLFYIIIMAYPIAQFCIFYIGVNFNSILLSVKQFNYDTGKYSFYGFKNFIDVFNNIRDLEYLKIAFKNSFIAYFWGLIFNGAFTLVFSYYIFKKCWASSFFSVILYLPSIIPSIALIIIYKYFCENAIPELASSVFNHSMGGLLSELDTLFPALLVFGLWCGFGGKMLLYSGTMGGVDGSMLESAQLDGVNAFQEFFLIIIPSIWPTITTFVVVGIAGIFTNQLGIYGFFLTNAEYQSYTVGYYLYRNTLVGTIADYPYLAAFGLFLTAITLPIVLITRKLLTKYGPSCD